MKEGDMPVQVTMHKIGYQKMQTLLEQGWEGCGIAISRIRSSDGQIEYGFVTDMGFVGWYNTSKPEEKEEVYYSHVDASVPKFPSTFKSGTSSPWPIPKPNSLTGGPED